MTTIKKQKLIKIELIKATNTELDPDKVKYIASHLNTNLLQAFPGRFDNEGKFVITDGNHRLAALKLIGAEYAPVVELTHEEWVRIAMNKESIEFLVERGYNLLTPPRPWEK